MNEFTDRLFETLDRAATRFGAVNALIDGIADRLAPKATAKADCSGPYPICVEWCTTNICYPVGCVDGQQLVYYVRMYSFTPSQFAQPCSAQCGECNDECGSYYISC
jgi:hypothetical protein